jgi:hypothetical protein
MCGCYSEIRRVVYCDYHKKKLEKVCRQPTVYIPVARANEYISLLDRAANLWLVANGYTPITRTMGSGNPDSMETGRLRMLIPPEHANKIIALRHTLRDGKMVDPDWPN